MRAVDGSLDMKAAAARLANATRKSTMTPWSSRIAVATRNGSAIASSEPRIAACDAASSASSRAAPARCGRLGQRPPDGRDERLEALLEHVVGGTGVESLDHELLAEGARDEDARHGGVPGVGDRHGSGTREARQGPIGQDQLGRERGQDGSELGLGRHHLRLDREAPVAQRSRGELGVVGRILDDAGPAPATVLSVTAAPR